MASGEQKTASTERQKVIKVSGGWIDGRSNGNRTGMAERDT